MTPREVEQELDKLEPPLALAYIDQVEQTIERTKLSEVERGLSTYAQEVIEAGAFVAFLELLRAGYIRAQRREIGSLPRARVIALRLEPNPNSARTAGWLAKASAEFLEQARVAQSEAVRAMVAAGAAQGRSTRQIALDVLGRLQPTGRRRGGVVGLSGAEAQAVAAARSQLASGDAKQLRAYLTRGLRERTFDARVRRAIDGETLRQAEIDRIAGEYSAKLLSARAMLLARTRSHEALGASRENLYLELADTGLRVTKDWKTRGDDAVRDSHESINGQRVAAQEAFRSGYGSLMRFPGDPSLGAPLRDRAGCRCVAAYKVRFNPAP